MQQSSESVAALAAALAKAQGQLVNPEKSLTATIRTGRHSYAARKILSASGNGKPGIGQDREWLKVWTDLPTTDEQYAINFYVCNRDEKSYTADGRLAVVLRGIGID